MTMKNSLLSFVCLLCNVLPFGATWWLFGQIDADAGTALIFGGLFTVIGMIAVAVSHLAFRDHPVSWLLSTLLLGFGKGMCIAAILLECYENVPHAEVYPAFLIAVCAVCVAFFVLLLLSRISFVRRHPKSVYIPLLILLCIGAAVFLGISPSPLGVLCLVFSGSLLVYWIARLLEFDESRELRFNLSMASTLYASLVLLLAIVLVAGDGCDCDGGCEGCDCGSSGGSEGKSKNPNPSNL